MEIRYFLNNDDGYNEVFPKVGKESAISWSRPDKYRMDYKREIKELTFIDDQFQYFRSIEDSDDRCEEQIIDIVSSCGVNMPEFKPFTGRFSMSEGDWDLELCVVKFKVKELDEFDCISENTDDINAFIPPFYKNYIIPVDMRTKKRALIDAQVGREFIYCCSNCDGPDECDNYDFDEGLYTFWKEVDLLGVLISIYVRFTMDIDCDQNIPDGWLLSKSCENGIKRISTKYTPNDEDTNVQITSRIFGEHYLEDSIAIDNGLYVFDVLEWLTYPICGIKEIGIVSDFFQWNPIDGSLFNYVTGEFNRWRQLLLFQKSDVKRRNARNNATKAPSNAKQLLEDVCKIFNCRYSLRDGTLRIEHVSFFHNNLGIDLLANDGDGLLRGTRRYEYDKSKLPKFEKFEFMESGGEDFAGVDIFYDSACVNNDLENKSTTSVENITTDLLHILANSSPDSDEVSDDGFVLLAISADSVRQEQNPLTGNITPNNVLSWPYLHDKLHRHDRVLKDGFMNNELTVFESTVPTIKQKKFSAIIDCGQLERFEPTDQMRGALGWGYVQSAEFNLSRCAMNVELLLEKVQYPIREPEFGDFDNDFNDEFD